MANCAHAHNNNACNKTKTTTTTMAMATSSQLQARLSLSLCLSPSSAQPNSAQDQKPGRLWASALPWLWLPVGAQKRRASGYNHHQL